MVLPLKHWELPVVASFQESSFLIRSEQFDHAGILDGDIAVLDAGRELKEGAIAAVLIEDEATLKRVYHTREGLVLKAENQAFLDIKIAASEAQRVRVLGVLVGIMRKV